MDERAAPATIDSEARDISAHGRESPDAMELRFASRTLRGLDAVGPPGTTAADA